MSKMTFTRKVSKKHVGVCFADYGRAEHVQARCALPHLHTATLLVEMQILLMQDLALLTTPFAPLMRLYMVGGPSARKANSFPGVS